MGLSDLKEATRWMLTLGDAYHPWAVVLAVLAFASLPLLALYGKRNRSGHDSQPGPIVLKIGLSSKSYQPLKECLSELQNAVNSINNEEQLRFDIDVMESEAAHKQFKNPGAYDLVMLDDPWVPEYADLLQEVGAAPGFNEYLKARGYRVDDLFPQLFVDSLARACTYRDKVLGVPVIGNVEVMIWRKDALDRIATSKQLADPEARSKLDSGEFLKGRFDKAASTKLFEVAKALEIIPLAFRQTNDADAVEVLTEFIRLSNGDLSAEEDAIVAEKAWVTDASNWLASHGVGMTFDKLRPLILANEPKLLAAVGWPGWIADEVARGKNLEHIRLQQISPQPVMGAWLLALPKTPRNREHQAHAARIALGLSTDPHWQLVLAKKGIVPVARMFPNADELQQVSFWNNNFTTVRDALSRAKPRPRSKNWATAEALLGRQFRARQFESARESHLIIHD